jgi:hypothetical protein
LANLIQELYFSLVVECLTWNREIRKRRQQDEFRGSDFHLAIAVTYVGSKNPRSFILSLIEVATLVPIEAHRICINSETAVAN